MEKAVKCTQNVLPDFVQVYSSVFTLLKLSRPEQKPWIWTSHF